MILLLLPLLRLLPFLFSPLARPRTHPTDAQSSGRNSARSSRFPKSVACIIATCGGDRKSTRLNSSHSQISYAVFCLKKKKKNTRRQISRRDATCPAPEDWTCTYESPANSAQSSVTISH